MRRPPGWRGAAPLRRKDELCVSLLLEARLAKVRSVACPSSMTEDEQNMAVPASMAEHEQNESALRRWRFYPAVAALRSSFHLDRLNESFRACTGVPDDDRPF